MALGGVAALGVVVAHLWGYALTFPDPIDRHLHLASTGHGHWKFVVGIAMGLLVAGIVHIDSGSWKWMGSRRPGPLFLAAASRLMFLQMGGFLALEATERLSSGGLSHLFTEPAVLVGLALQVLVALGGAALVLVVVKTVALTSRLRVRSIIRARTGGSPFRVVSRLEPSMLRVATGGSTPRGPPASS
jgi:hypothetical protein